jgi:hypothetical protein
MVNCKICNNEFTNSYELSHHVRTEHCIQYSIYLATTTDGFGYKDGIYYRICKCGEVRLLKNKYSFMTMYRNNDKYVHCSKCSCKGKSKTEEHKKKLSKPKTEEHKKKLSISALNRVVNTETEKIRREKLSIAFSGKNNPMYGKGYKLKGFKNGMYGKTHTDEIKSKLRQLQTKKYIESNNFCNYNKTACEYFNWLNMWNGWNGIHAENGGEYIVNGYWLDYYEPTYNIVIEWDEPHHYNGDSLKYSDVKRQNEIINELKCDFYRIKEREQIIYKVS